MGATTAVYAQGDLAGISGKITDANGSDLHNVTIVVKNDDRIYSFYENE
ncbi:MULTISPECIES: hypothetical protein [unclassified Empedobacter]|nr:MULTISPECIES: hypothetical protein [unclassified Empedobacter]MDH0658019.1 hypothetical protein [Empedobacter sp. GD03865]